MSASVHSLGGGSNTSHPMGGLMPSSAAPRSPSSSVCSYAGSVNSEILQANKYLMKTLCLAKKSATLPGKADYANLLTSGLGARKWVASLDFDAESFKAAIVNIYPRLSSVPSYTLWNVKPDKSFEKLPSTVNTPKRIKAYLGSSFTGSLIIMPSEEISLGPVKVPVMTGSGNHKFSSSTASVRSARSSSSSKAEKDHSSGYESMASYQDSNHGGSNREQTSSSSYYTPQQASSNSSSHTHNNQIKSHINSQQGSNGRSHRQICLTCGRLAKQAGSNSFYDIHNSTTFSTSDGYVSIAKKLRMLFHLELPRSKLVTSDQICRKCFRALNEIHFLETQLKRSKEEMMSTLFATVAKISKLEQIALQEKQNAAASSSDSSTSSLGTLMTAAALNPWFQEARYVIEQKALTAGIVAGNEKNSVSPSRSQEPSQEGPEHEGDVPDIKPPKQQQQAAVAIFQSHKSATGEGRYVDYSSPQPVFLAPLAGFTQQAAVSGNHGRHRSQSPAVDERSSASHQAMVPINLVSTRTTVSNDSRRSPHVSSAPAPLFLSNSPYYAQSSIREDHRDERRAKKRMVERDTIEEQMAAEEEAEAKEAAFVERDHNAYLEEAYHCRRRLEANQEKAARSQGHCSDSSRSSSMGNNSSPDSQSPSPPTTSSNGGSDSTNISNGECSYESKKYSSPKHERRSYWKKRYHDHKDDLDEEYGQDKKSPRMSVKSPEKQQRTMQAPSSGNEGTSGTETIKHGLIQSEESNDLVVDDQERA